MDLSLCALDSHTIAWTCLVMMYSRACAHTSIPNGRSVSFVHKHAHTDDACAHTLVHAHTFSYDHHEPLQALKHMQVKAFDCAQAAGLYVGRHAPVEMEMDSIVCTCFYTLDYM